MAQRIGVLLATILFVAADSLHFIRPEFYLSHAGKPVGDGRAPNRCFPANVIWPPILLTHMLLSITTPALRWVVSLLQVLFISGYPGVVVLGQKSVDGLLAATC